MSAPNLKLFGFFNSSASYRVRIALELKGMTWKHAGINLRKGEQQDDIYLGLNPAGLVPTLADGHHLVTQSLALIDYLDRLQPKPRLIPASGPARDRVLEIALAIACDIHPLNNLRVLKYLKDALHLSDMQKDAWYAHWIDLGFTALETQLPDHDGWCVGATPSLADCCLVPQVANALRMRLDLSAYPRIRRIHAHCQQHPAFLRATPGAQPDFIAA